jgi:hypothetical protein
MWLAASAWKIGMAKAGDGEAKAKKAKKTENEAA